MTVFSRRLGEMSVATAGAGATTIVFTVPAARTAIVKDIRLWLSAAAVPPTVITMSVNLAVGVSRSVLWASAAAAGQPFDISNGGVSDPRYFRLVLHPGDQFRVTQPANCTVQGYVSGVLLLGAPA